MVEQKETGLVQLLKLFSKYLKGEYKCDFDENTAIEGFQGYEFLPNVSRIRTPEIQSAIEKFHKMKSPFINIPFCTDMSYHKYNNKGRFGRYFANCNLRSDADVRIFFVMYQPITIEFNIKITKLGIRIPRGTQQKMVKRIEDFIKDSHMLTDKNAVEITPDERKELDTYHWFSRAHSVVLDDNKVCNVLNDLSFNYAIGGDNIYSTEEKNEMDIPKLVTDASITSTCVFRIMCDKHGDILRYSYQITYCLNIPRCSNPTADIIKKFKLTPI